MAYYQIRHRILDNRIALVAIRGGLDAQCALELKHLFGRLTSDGYLHYVLEVSDLSFAESPGFRLLIHEVDELRERGGMLVVVGLAGRVERAFSLLKLGDFVPVAGNVPSAVQMIRKTYDPGTALTRRAG